MGKLILFLISSFSVLFAVSCNDGMIVLHAPSSLDIEPTEELNLSYLKNVLSTAMGFTVPKMDEWSGMKVKKPFNFVKAIYMIYFPNMDPLNSVVDNYISVFHDEDVEETYNALKKEIEYRYPGKDSEVKKVILDDQPKVFASDDLPYAIDVSSNGPIESINSSHPNSEKDNMFIEQLNKLHSLTNNLLSKSQKTEKPDLFWVTVPNMGEIMALRDGDSKDVLMNALRGLSAKIKENYDEKDEKVMVVVLTGNEENEVLRRSKRETTASKDTIYTVNIATDYDEDFPIIFNIVFWFSLAMLFAVIAICMVIGGMDPGRDSIIYRMTSTRMKKDN